jgi:hemolysin activation/secretion protein
MFKNNSYNYLILISLSCCNNALANYPSYPEIDQKPDLLKNNIIPRENPTTPEAPSGYSDKDFENFSMLLKAIKITGNKAISDNELAVFYEKYIGKKVKYSEIINIFKSIEDEYKKRDYLLIYLVPKIDPKNKNIINIRIIEVGLKFQLPKNDKNDNKLLNEYISNIESCNPITRAVYERNIILIKKLPGLDINPRFTFNEKELKAGGTKILDIHLFNNKNDVTGLLYIDNHKIDKNSGPLTIWNVNKLNNLFGYNEIINLNVGTSGSFSKRKDLELGVSVPLDDNSLVFESSIRKLNTYTTENLPLYSFKKDFSYYKNENFVALKNTFLSKIDFDMKISYSPILLFNKSLTTSAGYSFTKFKTEDTRNNVLKSKYMIPRLYIAADYYFQDKYKADNYLNTILSTSGKFVGAKNYVSSLKYKSFLKSEIDYTRRDSFKYDLVTIFQAAGQVTDNTVPTIEKFQYGGGFFGKAYGSPIIIGDLGFKTKFKIVKMMYKKSKQLYLLAPYAYVDAGFTRDKKISNKASASSVGIGIEAYMRNGLRFDYSMNKPVHLKNTLGADKNKINHVIAFRAEYKF